MPSLKEAKHETVGIMTSEARAVNGASNIPGESLALGIDRDATNVEGDMTSEEKHTRVSAIVPAGDNLEYNLKTCIPERLANP